jgi:hypothetical protein
VTTLLTSPAVFAVALVEAVRWYRVEAATILMYDNIPVDAVGESLRTFTWGLLLFPLWWLPFGVLGAAVTAWVGRLRRSDSKPPVDGQFAASARFPALFP